MIASVLSAVASFWDHGERPPTSVHDGTTNASSTDTDSQRPCSDLYDLVLEMRWHWALKHVERRPQDAAWQDGDTLETPLHLACQNQPPVRLVKALLQAYPNAATTGSYKMRYLPIHLACRYNASIDVLRELLSGHPETAACENKYGTTPLHSLLEGRDTIANTETENYRTIFWQKVELLLRTIALTRGDERFLLHAAVSIGSLRCPEGILDFCLEQHARLVQTKDSSKRLPLHLAVGPAPYSKSSRRRYKPRELHVLHRLLELHPNAARAQDPNEASGRMPLHTALWHGHLWYGGVKDLFEAAPEMATVADPVTQLYPFLLAQDCDTSYKLLRAYPCVLGRAREHQWSQTSNRSSLESDAYSSETLRPSSDDRSDCPANNDLSRHGKANDHEEKEIDADWPNQHCFLAAFVVGTVMGAVCQLLPFLQGNQDKPPVRLLEDVP